MQTATLWFVTQCLNQLRYVVSICTRGKEFYWLLCNRITPYRVHRACHCPLLLSMSAGHSLTAHSFKIHIITIVPSPPSVLFASGIPAKRLCVSLLSATRVTFIALPFSKQPTVSLEPSLLAIGFRHFSMKNASYLFNGQNCLRRLAFWKCDPYYLSKRL